MSVKLLAAPHFLVKPAAVPCTQSLLTSSLASVRFPDLGKLPRSSRVCAHAYLSRIA